MNLPPVTSQAFSAMQNLNISELSTRTQREIRPFLPSLVRMSLLVMIILHHLEFTMLKCLFILLLFFISLQLTARNLQWIRGNKF